MNCIFCKIIKGELPSYKVYENKSVFAFLDIAPVNPGHVLVIPKKHYSNLEEIPEKELIEVIKVVKKIGKIMKDNLGVEGYNVNENNDPIAGQIIPHLHFHIIPRNKNDNFKLWPQKNYKDNEAEKILKKYE